MPPDYRPQVMKFESRRSTKGKTLIYISATLDPDEVNEYLVGLFIEMPCELKTAAGAKARVIIVQSFLEANRDIITI